MKRCLVLVAIFFSSDGYASDTNIDSRISAELSYLDLLSMEKGLVSDEEPEQDSLTKTFGLSQFIFQTSIKHSLAFFDFELRPRATDGALRWDSRAGSTYRAVTDLKLLDAYELGFFSNESFQASYGVFHRVSETYHFFDEDLSFGLEVWFPREFASAQISWTSQNYLENDNSYYQVRLFSLEDTGDRHEQPAKEVNQGEFGLLTSDPYTGAGFVFFQKINDKHSYELFFGYLDSRFELGRRNSNLYGASGSHQFSLFSYQTQLSWQARLEKERWSINNGSYPETDQVSYKAQFSFHNKVATDYFIGLQAGSSERPESAAQNTSIRYDGYQYTIGMLHKIKSYLDLKIIISDEWRELSRDDETVPGFVIDGRGENKLSRFLVQLNYYTDFNLIESRN